MALAGLPDLTDRPVGLFAAHMGCLHVYTRDNHVAH